MIITSFSVMINTIEYSERKNKQKDKNIGIILLVFGFILTLTAISIFPSESGWSSKYSVVGVIVSLIGFSKLIKKFQYFKRLLLNFGFVLVCINVLFILDFVNVINNNEPPKFSYIITTMDKNVIYNAPFYNVYRINKNTINEYYIIDIKKEYTIDTVPISSFNRSKSGIDNIIKYKNKYVGDNSNTGNLINNLPLSEYGYVFEIDSTNLGLIIDYHITDWYINDELYLEKSLIYNSVSIFSLIDNLEYITYNFTGNSYTVTKKEVEEKYPNYSEVISDNKNFSNYLENKMNDNEFVENVYKEIFNQ